MDLSSSGTKLQKNAISINDVLHPIYIDKLSGAIGLGLMMKLFDITHFSYVYEILERLESKKLRLTDLAAFKLLIDIILKHPEVNDLLTMDLKATKAHIQMVSELVARVAPPHCLRVVNQYL